MSSRRLTRQGRSRRIQDSPAVRSLVAEFDRVASPPSGRTGLSDFRFPARVGTASTLSTDWRDPVTFQKLRPRDAYYIGPNASNGKVHHVYSHETIRELLKSGRGTSPMTRHSFGTTDVFRAQDPSVFRGQQYLRIRRELARRGH